MSIYQRGKSKGRECISTGEAGARTSRDLGHHLLHPLILRLLVLCAPADPNFLTHALRAIIYVSPSTSSTKITDCLRILRKACGQRVLKVLSEFDKPDQSFKWWLLGCVPEQIKFHNVQKFTIKTGISSSFLFFCNVQHVHCNQSKFGVKNVYILTILDI